VTSSLPDHARNAHGNLAEQNRLVGPQRGVDTTRAGAGAAVAVAAIPAPVAPTAARPASGGMPNGLLQMNTCTSCHAPDRRIVGPSWSDVAKKHAGKADYITGKIRSGGAGVWGSVPMPPQSIKPEDARRIAEWLSSGAQP